MKDTLFSGRSCRKIGSKFCSATLPSMTLLINKRIGPQIALLQWDQFGGYLTIIWLSVLHQVSFWPLMRLYIQLNIRLLLNNIIPISLIQMIFSGSLWKNAPFCYTYKAVPYAAKTSARDSPYYINATVYYIKYLITETKRQVNL